MGATPELILPFYLDPVQGTDCRAVILLAASQGWKVQANKRHWQLIAPDGVDLTIPLNTGLRENVFRSWVRKVLRHGTGNHLADEVVAALADTANLDRHHKRLLRSTVASFGMPGDEHDEDDHDDDPPEPILPPSTPKVRTRQQRNDAIDTALARHESATARAGQVVDRRPARSHGQNGRTYDSPVVDIETMADGTSRFACNSMTCTFRSDSIRSVASHAAQAHRRGLGRGDQPAQDGFDPEHVVNPRTVARIDALASALQEAWDAGHRTPESMAAFVVERRLEHEGESAAQALALTPEQILDRIAILVDRGRSATLAAEAAEAREALDITLARAERAESNLAAVRDMLTEATAT